MEAIRNYVESLFSSIPRSEDASRLKEDMLLNLEEKYNNLIASGKTEAEAVGTVILGIGSVDDLKAALKEEKKDARLKISFKGLDVTDGKDHVHVGWDGVRVVESAEEDSEDFETYGDEERIFVEKRQNRFPFEAILWPLCIIAFLILGFLYNLWHPAWLLFIGATLITILYNTWTDRRKEGKLLGAIEGCLWILLIAGYLYAGFAHGLWHPGWLVFPIAALLEGIVHTIIGYCKSKKKNDE